jgi:hypothetical protein
VNGVRKGPKLFELARLEQFAACPHFSRIGSPTFRTACRALLGGDGRSRTRKRDFRDGPQIDQRDPERESKVGRHRMRQALSSFPDTKVGSGTRPNSPSQEALSRSNEGHGNECIAPRYDEPPQR